VLRLSEGELPEEKTVPHCEGRAASAGRTVPLGEGRAPRLGAAASVGAISNEGSGKNEEIGIRGGSEMDTGEVDGASKSASRRRPLLIVNTGDGKGKSTAAFGIMLRCWARGYKIGVFQFIKSDKWKVGEQKAAEALGNIDWYKLGDSWTWISEDLENTAELARRGWDLARQKLMGAEYQLVILDEFTYPLRYGWIEVGEVLEVLKSRPGFQHVVITGRNAPPELIEAADLVSRIESVKHPKDQGYMGQRGIEW
jgi:cob(I)alamin adenosyltransferase